MTTFKISELTKRLKNEYKMDCQVYDLDTNVIFFGSELECYKMAYRFKNKENSVGYSENLKTWYVSFNEWFSIGFAQKIVK